MSLRLRLEIHYTIATLNLVSCNPHSCLLDLISIYARLVNQIVIYTLINRLEIVSTCNSTRYWKKQMYSGIV